ncbi:MAG: leucine-rich repeat domain-containing protein [Candidatus Latescibacteria bacterium]|nr:leucine-rich repeat domain-containing protein [Candidatus Latescibacterota bacterium]
MATTKFYNIREVDSDYLKELIWAVQRTGQRIIFRDENRPIGALIPHQQLPGTSREISQVSPGYLMELRWMTQEEGQRIILTEGNRPIADLIPHQEIPSYPQNYMTMLDTLYHNERWDELHARFNFFAFMIHDSETHPDFDQQIKEYLFDHSDQFMNENNFDRLNQVTNENDKLLFFALVDSSPQENRDSNLLRDRNTQEVPELSRAAISLTHSIASIDPSIRAVSLASSLEISNERLPCLVVTPDLHSKQFRWLRTDPDSLDDQLYHLRNLAYRVQGFGRFGKERIISEYLQQISPYSENGTIYLMGERNFGSALANVMTCTVAGHSPFPEEMKPAWEKSKDILLDLQDGLKQLKEQHSGHNDARKQAQEAFFNFANTLGSKLTEEELEEHFSEIVSSYERRISETDLLIEKTCEKIALYLASLMPYHPNLKSFIGINEEFLEDDSCRMLKTAQAVLNMLNHPDFAPLDYTPGVICLAKIFEREVNLSVIHWIRQQLEVDLPAYFDRFQKNLEKAEFDNINFNAQGNHNAWRPPMLGQSEKACNAVATATVLRPAWEAMISEWVNTNQWQILLDKWKVITENRNVGAHELSVDKSVADDIKKALDKLKKEKIFDELYRMKKIYRGDITIPDTNLQVAIEKALKKPSGATITAAEMAHLGKKNKFHAANKGIRDLTGLESAANLKSLFLQDNNIIDLTPLEDLTTLIVLDLKNNPIKDLTPLKNLKNLKRLSLDNTSLNAISKAKHIPDLQNRGVSMSF